MIHNTILLKTAPWTINQPIVKLELTKLFKTKTHPIIFQEKILNIQNNFPDHHHTYTDASKQGMKFGCAAIFQSQELLKHHPDKSSIYRAEVTAIGLAINIVVNHKSSKSFLLALQNKDTSTPFIAKILNKMNTLSKNNILLTWIPSHIGIHGNEDRQSYKKKHS